MTLLLTDNIPIIAGSPNGVKKLRELILQLALMGKLVPQNPKDEPAHDLLDKITKQKDDGAAAKGKSSKAKANGGTATFQAVTEIPPEWIWTNLDAITYINPRNSVSDEVPASFVPMTLIGTTFSGNHESEQRLWKEMKQGFTHFADGDIGIAKITPCFENSKACVFEGLMNGVGAGTTELHIVRPVPNTLNPRYVLAYFKSPMFLKLGESKMTGTAGQKRLPKEFVQFNPFPLPPRAEQNRIVEKLDELMRLCDQLESEQSNGETAHGLLLKTLLKALLEAKGRADFDASWILVKENFDVLFTTEASVDALKQILVQLAVMGKIVAQRAEEEPASKVLKVIHAEKTRLIAQGRVKSDKLPAELPKDEHPFVVPSSWSWASLGAVASVVDPNPSHRMPRYVQNGIPFISTENFGEDDSIDFSIGKSVAQETLEEQIAKFEIREGAFAVSRIGTIGKTRRLPIKRDYAISHALCVISPYLPVLCSKYLRLAITADCVFRRAQHGVQSIGVPDLGVGTLRALPIPIPPAEEQQRIVSKVEQLVALCEELKAELSQARARQEVLATTLIETSLTVGANTSKKEQPKLLVAT